MDLGRILQMIVNLLLRKAVNKGVNMGINHLSRGGKTPDQMTPEERIQAKQARDMAQRTRQITRVARRFWR